MLSDAAKISAVINELILVKHLETGSEAKNTIETFLVSFPLVPSKD